MLMLMNGDYFGVGGRRACFTENYLVFSLNERMPQITEMYLDKEDDVLDYCKRVIFNPAVRRNASAEYEEQLLNDQEDEADDEESGRESQDSEDGDMSFE